MDDPIGRLVLAHGGHARPLALPCRRSYVVQSPGPGLPILLIGSLSHEAAILTVPQRIRDLCHGRAVFAALVQGRQDPSPEMKGTMQKMKQDCRPGPGVRRTK